MSSEPFTVFVADDLALADVEHWLSFDEAVLPHPPPSTDDPHSLTQLLPDLPFIPSDPSLAFLTDDLAPRPSPSRRGDMGVGGLRGPSADPPSAPPPCKLPRRPPDLSSRLAAVLQNINPPRPAPSPWQPVPCLPKPGLPSAATPAAAAAAAAIPPAAAAAAPAAASAVAAAAAVAVAVACAVSSLKAPESRLVVGSSRGDASGFLGSTLLSSAARTSDAAAYRYDQRVQWPAAFSDKTAIRKIRVCAAHSDPLSTDPDGEEISASASSRAFFAAPDIPEFGPERPLRVDVSGMLPRPMCGAKEGMLKQQLMALAEAMAVDDSVREAVGDGMACVTLSLTMHTRELQPNGSAHSHTSPLLPLPPASRPSPHQVRWRQFMRQVRREAAAGGDTLQRIAFHALEALEARMDGTAITRWRSPLQITLQVLTLLTPHLPPSPPTSLPPSLPLPLGPSPFSPPSHLPSSPPPHLPPFLPPPFYHSWFPTPANVVRHL
ncbi:unnamed protein product [Closterium sp. Naga37s-1]|nr:unnamed protein product [Closterium sp. Naga37s-1]